MSQTRVFNQSQQVKLFDNSGSVFSSDTIAAIGCLNGRNSVGKNSFTQSYAKVLRFLRRQYRELKENSKLRFCCQLFFQNPQMDFC